MTETIIFNLLYKWKYLIAILKSRFLKKEQKTKLESITYVAREVDKEWIFGAKVKRLARFSSLKATTYHHDRLRDLPESDGYFFIFHHYFYRAMRHNPQILNKRNIVMFTHANFTKSFSRKHVIWCLNKADKVICLNSDIRKELIDSGLKEEKTELLHIASDPNFFFPHNRKPKGAVGFCSAFSNRKNPDLVFSIIKNDPSRDYILIGKNWEKYKNYKELISFTNFTYYNDVPYSTYPELYNKIDIFISPSINEGGPVPVLEAMLSNCFPIATKTGFGPDIIKHGVNGFLINHDEHYNKVIELIDKADEKDIDVRQTVLNHSWQKCSKKIDELFLEKKIINF